MRRWFAIAAVSALLVACGRPTAILPSGSGAGTVPSAFPATCYVTRIAPTPVKATITFYGWPDNSPPGNAIAHPVIHRVASGAGTYCDPTTFATERKNDEKFPYGTKLYVPLIRQYFIREDDCAASGPKRGHGNNGCYGTWFDLWIGGDARSEADNVIDCENALTPNGKVNVIVDPKPDLPVRDAGAIYRDDPRPDGTCDGRKGAGA